MKVLMTTDAGSGVLNYSLNLAEGLQRHGVQVVLACMGPAPSSIDKQRLRKQKGLSFCHCPLKAEWMDNPWKEVDAADDWLLNLAGEIKPDVVHLNGFVHAALPWNCPVVVVGHSCLYSPFWAVNQTAPPANWHQYYGRVSAGIKQASVFVASSAEMLEQFRKIFKVLPPSQVIYTGLNPTPWQDLPKEKIVFSLGEPWDELKNADILLEAAARIKYPVYIAGDFNNKPLKVPQNIHFAGRLSRAKVNSFLRKAAVFALPVKYEPFGLSFLEAAGNQCALLGGDIATLHEIWGDAMFYASADSPEEVAWGCNTILDDERYRSHLAAKAHQHSLKYTLVRKVQQYNHLYRKLQTRIPNLV